jgi:hypothetical protein
MRRVRARIELIVGTVVDGVRLTSTIGSVPVTNSMNKARLRENARILRTLQREFVDVGKAAIAAGHDDEGNVDAAEGNLLGALVGSILVLTEELAGDIDQD